MKNYAFFRALFFVFGVSIISFNVNGAAPAPVSESYVAFEGEQAGADIWSNSAGESDAADSGTDEELYDEGMEHEDTLDSSFGKGSEEESEEEPEVLLGGYSATLNSNLGEYIDGSWNEQFVIIINGPTCSGKSRLAKLFTEENEGWEIIAMDDIVGEDAVLATIQAIKESLNQGKNIICDTVLIDIESINLFKQAFSEKTQFAMCFLHNSFKQLLANLSIRNTNTEEQRDLGQVLEAMIRFYIPTDKTESCIETYSNEDKSALERLAHTISPERFERLASNKIFQPRTKLELKDRDQYAEIINNESKNPSPLQQLTDVVNSL